MKVRMKVSVSGLRNGKNWPEPGKTLTVGDDEGAALCAAGIAEPVAQKPKAETATKKRRAETRKKSG